MKPFLNKKREKLSYNLVCNDYFTSESLHPKMLFDFLAKIPLKAIKIYYLKIYELIINGGTINGEGQKPSHKR